MKAKQQTITDKLNQCINDLQSELNSFTKGITYAYNNSFSFGTRELIERVQRDLKHLKHIERCLELESLASDLNSREWELYRSIDHVYGDTDSVKAEAKALAEQSLEYEMELRALLGLSLYNN